jgi:hypothetical protein
MKASAIHERFGSGLYALRGIEKAVAKHGLDLDHLEAGMRDAAESIRRGEDVREPWGLAGHNAKAYRAGKPLPKPPRPSGLSALTAEDLAEIAYAAEQRERRQARAREARAAREAAGRKPFDHAAAAAAIGIGASAR